MAIPFKRDALEVNAPFTVTRRDPVNEQREQHGSYFSRAKPLSVRERHKLTARLGLLEKQLREVKYDEARAELDELIEGYKSGAEDVRLTTTGEQLARNVVAARGKRMQEYVRRLRPLVLERDDLLDQLDKDDLAMADLNEDRDRQEVLRQNVITYGEIIIETWTGLGFFQDKGSKKKVRKVEFERVHANPSFIEYKIKITSSGIFGRRRRLPPGVRLHDQLLDESTMRDLTLACGRLVTALPTKNNGAWLRVSLTDAGDDLPEYIHLEEVMSYFPDDEKHLIPIPLGVTPGRNIDFLYMANQAHLLVAGGTGGAKSNYLNLILMALMMKYSPLEVQFMLIDLKAGGVEFQPYREAAHLLTDVVTEAESIPREFARLENLMKERGAKFNEAGVRNIIEYNQKVPEAERMSHVFVIFDEFASIKVPRKKKLAEAIHAETLQLLAKGRYAGVHVVLCTQYPNVDVISSIGKANLATRICGPFPQKSLSLAVFDSGIAAELPSQPGRMAALVDGTIFPVQTPHVPTEWSRETLRGLLAATRRKPGQNVEVLPRLTAQQAEQAAAMVGADAPQLPPQVSDFERLGRIAVEQLGGALTARRIFDVVKPELTLARVQEIVLALQTGGRVELDGRVYVVEQRSGKGGRGFILVPEDMKVKPPPSIAMDLSP